MTRASIPGQPRLWFRWRRGRQNERPDGAAIDWQTAWLASMVNRVLTSPYLWWFDPFSGRSHHAIGCLNSAGALRMAMTASSRAPQGTGQSGKPSARHSARLTELLAPYQPAKPLITLSLGEPQHPVPGFVGPVLAKHTAEFGRYPHCQGASSRSGGRRRTGFPPGSTCRGRSIPRPSFWC